jgi:hypothetical protein
VYLVDMNFSNLNFPPRTCDSCFDSACIRTNTSTKMEDSTEVSTIYGLVERPAEFQILWDAFPSEFFSKA